MDITIDHSGPYLDCDGRFEVPLTFRNNAKRGDPINVRIVHQPQYDDNVRNVQLDHDLIALKPQQTHQVTLTAQLRQRCGAGQLDVAWWQTIGGAEIPGTKEDLLVVVPPAPFLADEDRDPVVADPAGVFRYTVTLECCNAGAPPQQRNVPYQTGTDAVEHLRASPRSPVPLDCSADATIEVVGILESPRQVGQVTITISGGGRCAVVTKIAPHPSPDRAAHRLALEEWAD